MNPTEREKKHIPLEKMTALWKDIAVHQAKGTVFFVDASLDIEAVGRAVAQDNVQYIEDLLTSGKLFRLSADQTSAWTDKVCRFVIVQPYIFVERVL